MPSAGVYTYTGSGSETVQLGPIPAETRAFPTEINGVVTRADPVDDETCFETTLNVIEQHTENSTYCRTPAGGIRLEHYEKHQKVSAFEPTVDIRCDPGVIWDPGTAELPLACSLRLLGGPKEVSVDLPGTATAIEGGTFAIESVPGAEVQDRGIVDLELHGFRSERCGGGRSTATALRTARSGSVSHDDERAASPSPTSPRGHRTGGKHGGVIELLWGDRQVPK